MIKFLLASLILMFLNVLAEQAWAAVPANDAVEFTKQKIAQEEKKQRLVLSTLFDLNKKIKRSVTERGRLLREQDLLETSVADLQQDIQENAKVLKSQRMQLAQRLRAIYKFGAPSVARLLFGTSNPTTLDRNLRILGIVAAQDRELIKNYVYDIRLLKNRKKKLDQRLASLKDIQAKVFAKEARLVIEQKNKSKILDGIRRSKAFAISKLEDLKRQVSKMDIEDTGILDSLYKPSFGDLKGQLPTPVVGRIVQPYGIIQGGNKIDSKRMTWSLSHKGVLIDVWQNDISAVYDGVVVYSDYIPSFGNTMIIDHGDHYYTVYSGFSESTVRLGDEVKQAQNIAKLETQKKHLYFEVRHFSETYDPKDWTKGLSL